MSNTELFHNNYMKSGLLQESNGNVGTFPGTSEITASAVQRRSAKLAKHC